MGVIKINFIFNSVRLMENDQAKEFALGDESTLQERLAIALINPNDYNQLNPNKKPNLKISSKYGKVIIKVLINEDVPEGTILMPVSIWSNQITGIENSQLILKNIEVNLETTEEPIDDFNGLIKKIREIN